MTAGRKKHTGPLVPPQGAVGFRLDKLTIEKGQRRRRRMKGQAEADGVVPDAFPAAAFSAANVLAMWGAGKYRVEFLDETGATIAGTTRHFEVAEPVRRKKGATLTRDDQEDEGDAAAGDRSVASRVPRPSGPGESFTFRDFFEFQMATNADRERREEIIRQRSREDAAAARAQDREFLGTIIGVLGQRGGGGAGVDMDLIRREMQVTVREQMLGIRRELNAALQEREEPEEPEEPEGDPPANLEEATNRVGMRLLQELEAKTPGLLEKGLPQILDWVKSAGFKPSPGLERQIHGRTNGTGGAGSA